ncbi:MAG: DNA topoisomerase IV, partial [Actinobacteria bacterium]|nr:DNA topoisomerase IV [Actinomycetota bacterium]
MPRQEELFGSFAREVIDVPVTDEMENSYLAYSLSVITARAIPDIRDGLKPVQRRILHSMANNGLRPDRPHRKCAGVVGDTMGKYHPHGAGPIYDALTNMGQDFSRNITLLDPHGNFG